MAPRRIIQVGLLAALVAVAAARAEAATGLSIKSYGIGIGQDSFDAFDPSLGTLKSVHIEISGDIIPLILSDSAGDLDPLFITQSFVGFAGKGFSTQFAATIPGQFLTTAPGAPGIAIAPYKNAITFDALTDFVGFAADTYGSTYTGKLADFLPGGPSGDQIIEFPTYTAWALGSTGAMLTSIDTFLSGGGMVTYEYEIAEPPPPAPGAPEPGTWLMLLTGFAMLGAQARRRRVA